MVKMKFEAIFKNVTVDFPGKDRLLISLKSEMEAYIEYWHFARIFSHIDLKHQYHSQNHFSKINNIFKKGIGFSKTTSSTNYKTRKFMHMVCVITKSSFQSHFYLIHFYSFSDPASQDFKL
uniref:Uncharacterized protein n=1 Tax=Anguilla anguilla TaxID=7936 RepID=A0A0E9RS21_ANGAN